MRVIGKISSKRARKIYGDYAGIHGKPESKPEKRKVRSNDWIPEESSMLLVECPNCPPEKKRQYLRGTLKDYPPGKKRYCIGCGKFGLFRVIDPTLKAPGGI